MSAAARAAAWSAEVRRRRPVVGNLLLALAVAAIVVPLHGRTGVRLVEARAFDILSMLAPARPAEPSAIIIAIDEPSFAAMPTRWPWSRDIHARLIERLKQAGARVVALDILFAEESDPDADAALALALGPGQVLAADREVIAMEHGTQVSVVAPLPAFLARGAVFGITAVDLDGDGVLRRVPDTATSFAATVLRQAGEAVAPVPDRALIQYFGPARSYRTVSYYQALDADRHLPPGLFKDRLVLVGLSLKVPPLAASGSADAFLTPVTIRTGTLTAGVEVHATLIDNLRHGLWVAPASFWTIAAAVLICALLGCGGGGAASMSWRTAALVGLSLLAVVAASWALLRFGRIWLPPVTPVLAGFLAFGVRFGLDYRRERRLRAAVSSAFSRYVTPDLVDELVRNPDALKLGGERRELTVLFCDVRGFTSLSERLKDDPVRLTGIINRLLDTLSEQVLAARGTIDKYMGDCVMAFWNAPLPEPRHAQAAVAAALAMSRAAVELGDVLLAEDPALPRLAVGVGVNSGMCVVGNIGSRWRYDYSVLGDAVNLASRLEGMTKEYAVPIILGEATAQLVASEFLVFELDRIAVRGRREATPIYTVIGELRGQEALAVALGDAQRRFAAARQAGDLAACDAALQDCCEAWPPLVAYCEKMSRIVAAERESPI